MMRSLILSAALLAALGACGKKTPADATPEPDAVADAGAPPAMDAEDPAGEPVEPASVLPDPQTTDIADLPRTITVDNDTLKADISFDEAIFGYAPAMAMDVVEDARIRRPWERLAAAGVRDRPVAISESGSIAAWAPGHFSLTPAQPTFQISPKGLPQS